MESRLDDAVHGGLSTLHVRRIHVPSAHEVSSRVSPGEARAARARGSPAAPKHPRQPGAPVPRRDPSERPNQRRTLHSGPVPATSGPNFRIHSRAPDGGAIRVGQWRNPTATAPGRVDSPVCVSGRLEPKTPGRVSPRGVCGREDMQAARGAETQPPASAHSPAPPPPPPPVGFRGRRPPPRASGARVARMGKISRGRRRRPGRGRGG